MDRLYWINLLLELLRSALLSILATLVREIIVLLKGHFDGPHVEY